MYSFIFYRIYNSQRVFIFYVYQIYIVNNHRCYIIIKKGNRHFWNLHFSFAVYIFKFSYFILCFITTLKR